MWMEECCSIPVLAPEEKSAAEFILSEEQDLTQINVKPAA